MDELNIAKLKLTLHHITPKTTVEVDNLLRTMKSFELLTTALERNDAFDEIIFQKTSKLIEDTLNQAIELCRKFQKRKRNIFFRLFLWLPIGRSPQSWLKNRNRILEKELDLLLSQVKNPIVTLVDAVQGPCVCYLLRQFEQSLPLQDLEGDCATCGSKFHSKVCLLQQCCGKNAHDEMNSNGPHKPNRCILCVRLREQERLLYLGNVSKTAKHNLHCTTCESSYHSDAQDQCKILMACPNANGAKDPFLEQDEEVKEVTPVVIKSTGSEQLTNRKTQYYKRVTAVPNHDPKHSPADCRCCESIINLEAEAALELGFKPLKGTHCCAKCGSKFHRYVDRQCITKIKCLQYLEAIDKPQIEGSDVSSPNTGSNLSDGQCSAVGSVIGPIRKVSSFHLLKEETTKEETAQEKPKVETPKSKIKAAKPKKAKKETTPLVHVSDSCNTCQHILMEEFMYASRFNKPQVSPSCQECGSRYHQLANSQCRTQMICKNENTVHGTLGRFSKKKTSPHVPITFRFHFPKECENCQFILSEEERVNKLAGLKKRRDKCFACGSRYHSGMNGCSVFLDCQKHPEKYIAVPGEPLKFESVKRRTLS